MFNESINTVLILFCYTQYQRKMMNILETVIKRLTRKQLIAVVNKLTVGSDVMNVVTVIQEVIDEEKNEKGTDKHKQVDIEDDL